MCLNSEVYFVMAVFTCALVQALPGAAERLKLFKADLMAKGSFDEAFEGCSLVVHSASPYTVSVSGAEAKAKIIKPAIEGTENVLASVNKVSSIMRVVLTSSCAAVYGK
jgi:nucleoside-diphosphate-sugar epimerase